MTTVDTILAALSALPADAREESRGERTVVAIAGPPAAGKTTIANALQAHLGDAAVVLGLDAFHFDDAILEARGQRQRKGAPFTFDVDGYRRTLTDLRAEPTHEMTIPLFDRTLELARNCAEIVPTSCRVIITEGNYLLLDQPGWEDLRALFDLTVMVEVPEATVRARILKRWQELGFSEAEAIERATDNDLPNAQAVQLQSGPADLVLSNS